jgi:hypothetical protein
MTASIVKSHLRYSEHVLAFLGESLLEYAFKIHILAFGKYDVGGGRPFHVSSIFARAG